MDDLLIPLAWDSDFFGFPIGRATVTQLNEACVTALLAAAQAAHLRCLYFEAVADDPLTVTLAERHGFHLVDVRVTLELAFDHALPTAPSPPRPVVMTGPRAEEMPRLREIAAGIGYASRFNFDHNFPPGAGERLYRRWIENACAGFADAVFIARREEAGEAAGLITCTLRDGWGHIQLTGVHPDHRRQGVGVAVVRAGLEWAKAQGAAGMRVPTQARNIQAQRLYQQVGFLTHATTLFYHKWFE
jgi:GNAT superfamily N-acetyltransferase